MAEMVHTDDTPTRERETVYRGKSGNLATGAIMLVAGAAAFGMGMTDVFFARALAWVFIIWGALLVFIQLLDIYSTTVVTDDALLLRSPMRFWSPQKRWGWGNINRMDIVVSDARRAEPTVVLQTYYTPTGEVTIEREDHPYYPGLARQVIEHAVLSPEGDAATVDLDNLPAVNATYTWK